MTSTTTVCTYCLADPCSCGLKLPDAKSRANRRPVRTPFGWMDRIYCVNCGSDGGIVTPNAPVFYLCNACAEVHGKLSAPEISPELVRPVWSKEQ